MDDECQFSAYGDVIHASAFVAKSCWFERWLIALAFLVNFTAGAEAWGSLMQLECRHSLRLRLRLDDTAL